MHDEWNTSNIFLAVVITIIGSIILIARAVIGGIMALALAPLVLVLGIFGGRRS